MIALRRGLVTCALAALLAGCGELPAIFEDVGANPHPPEFTLLGVAVQPPGDPPPPPDFQPPGTVLTFNPFNKAASQIALLGEYRDAGADITAFVLWDHGVGPADAGRPVAGTARPYARSAAAEADDDPVGLGTSGRVWIIFDPFPASVQGTHTLEVFAVDSKEGRSAKTRFAAEIQLF